VGVSRTEADFAAHLDILISQDPSGEWILITDQLNTHQSEAAVRLVARYCELDATHRIRFVYTPKHSSWLNQIEIWFSILMRRLLKRGNFTSQQDSKTKILAFIDYFNTTMAKPFKWTYKGKPLQV